MAAPSPRSARTVAYARLSDESLARRAAAGSDAAFTALYERYHEPLLGYCRSILLDAEDARDATQSALENALRALPRREPGRPLKPWLYRIAHNEAINIVRRRQAQAELVPKTPLTVPGPEADAETRGYLSQLVSDLRELPERQRGALVMRELSGLSYDEIGGALGVTNESARRAVFDARSALHAAVAGRETACVSIRHKLSDGDRRGLRARSIRAHLRSCDDCASFLRSISVRRTGLHAIGWLPGTSGLGLLGSIGLAGGAGGAGGGALIAAGGASAVPAGGLGFAGLSTAAKGLAVAAAVATSGGAAAVEIRHITKDETRAPKAMVAEPAAVGRTAPALISPRTVVSSTAPEAATRSAAPGRASVRPRSSRARRDRAAHTPAPRSPRASRLAGAPAAAAPAAASARSDATPAPDTDRTTSTAPVEISIGELTALRDQLGEAYEEAQTAAAAGTPAAMKSATTTLEQALDAVRPILDRVLATVGLTLPRVVASLSPTAANPTPANILQPVRQLLSGVDALLKKLFPRRAH